MNDDDVARALFPRVYVLKKDEPLSFNTSDWPIVALMLVTAACNRQPMNLTKDEVQELVLFFGTMQRRLEQWP